MNIELNPRRAGAMLNASVALLLSTAAMAVGAAPITVEYTGVVSRLWTADCVAQTNGNCTGWNSTDVSSSDFFDGRSVAVGGSFAGRFTYESTAPVSAISADGANAMHFDSVSGVQFQTGELSLPSVLLPFYRGSFSVVNDQVFYSPPIDSFFVSSWFNSGGWFADLSLSLIDNTAAVFDTFDVPQTLDFGDFDANVLTLGFVRRADGDQLQLEGRLNSMRMFSVPEPSSVVLLLAALAGLVGATYRKRQGLNA